MLRARSAKSARSLSTESSAAAYGIGGSRRGKGSMDGKYVRKFECSVCGKPVVADFETGEITCSLTCAPQRIPQWVLMDPCQRRKWLKDNWRRLREGEEVDGNQCEN